MKIVSFSAWGQLVCLSPAIHYLFVMLFLICCVQKTAMGQQEINFKHYITEKNQAGDNVQSIIQDQRGWLWIGTTNGLKRFDGQEFHAYKHDPGDTSSLISNAINVLYEDSQGKIWVGTANGLDRFDPDTEKFFHYQHNKEDLESLSSSLIRCLLEDSNGNLWVGTSSGLNRLHRDTDQFDRYFFNRPGSNSLRDSEINAISEDESGVIWLGTKEGLLHFDSVTEKFDRFPFEADDPLSLSNSGIRCLYRDRQGRIWVGGGGGLSRFDPITRQIDRFQLEPGKKIAVSTIFEDRAGNVWVGSSSVLSSTTLYRYNEASNQFSPHFSDTYDGGENYREISAIFQDREGTYWLGMNGSGLYSFSSDELDQPYRIYSPSSDPSTTVFGTAYKDSHGIYWVSSSEGLHQFDPVSKAYKTLLPASKGKSKKRIGNMLEDQYQDMWFGGDGLKRFDRETQQFHDYDLDLYDPTCRPCNAIRFIYEDRKGDIWIGTLGGGLHSYDRDKDQLKLEWYDPDGTLLDNAFQAIFADRYGRLWFGGGGGLQLFEPGSKEATRIQHGPEHPKGLSGRGVRAIFEDKNGSLWIGTDHGLNLLKEGTAYTFEHFLEKDGLAGNAANYILEDKYDRLWISTNKGLSIFNPTSRSFWNLHNLFGRGISVRMLFIDEKTDEIWLTGTEIPGFLVIHPDSLPHNEYEPPVYISRLGIYDHKKKEDGFTNIQAPWAQKKLTFPHHQNTLTAKFAILSYKDPARNQVAYTLEGVQDDWISIGAKREATFSNLAPGKYTLRVKGSNNDGVWNEEGAALQITILPPWWLTIWANIAYFLLAAGILYSAYRYQLNRKLTLAEARRLKELDQVKTKLFTNITHEFRTPLTVIQGTADEEIEREGGLPREKVLENAQMIKRNSAQLLNLVNQMLDLRKLESGAMPINLIRGDVVQYLKYLTESFHSHAQRKSVGLHFLPERKTIVMDYDPEKMLYIVSNLLSNAVKFTAAGGNVYFSAAPTADAEQLTLAVKDTGIGIEAEKLPHIFDRFYQTDDSTTRQGGRLRWASAPGEGTGIGLALTKELVKLLGGEIDAKSEPGEGSVFTVHLPITRNAAAADVETTGIANKTLGFVGADVARATTKGVPAGGDEEAPLALVIEDNPDVLRYLSACLENDYRIVTALDGQTGVETAIDTIPDIIVSDVMMPRKDGYEVCDILKNDERTSHIPIILLTAKADQDSRITGLRAGADAYLAKPFHRRELQVRLEQLIEIRRKLQERYAGLDPQELNDKAYLVEDQFLRKVRQIVEDNISDADFGLPQLCRAIGLSRSQLFRKLKALTGKSTTLVIRSIRLQRARQLLQKSDLNVSEVAYEVGFRDPAYFSKCFQEEYGEAPSAVKG